MVKCFLALSLAGQKSYPLTKWLRSALHSEPEHSASLTSLKCTCHRLGPTIHENLTLWPFGGQLLMEQKDV